MDPSTLIPEPLAYHRELRDYLRFAETDLWQWFASVQVRADYTEHLNLELLKSTYRLSPDTHPELHQLLAEAKTALQLDIPVTLYQAQNHPQPNAALYFVPNEGHIVFSGPVLTLLTPDELKSVLGHELAHHRLWQWENGDLHVVDRLLQAVANDPRAARSHLHTARRFQLYTEIYADRGSWCVTQNLDPIIAGLVKIQTGLQHVSAAAYLRQAEEIFARGNIASDGISHPEAFIRARALSLWRDRTNSAAADSETNIAHMIEGPTSLDSLDLPKQHQLALLTRRLLQRFLRPRWLHTPAVLGHARLFFPDFHPDTPDVEATATVDEIRHHDPQLTEYWCFLLLDFATADPDLEDLPLIAALAFSSQLGLDATFEKLAARELKRKPRELRKLKDEASNRLAKLEEAR